MTSREETATIEDRRTGERQQYPDKIKFQQRPTDDSQTAAKALKSEDQGQDSSSTAVLRPYWLPLSTHKWTPQQRAKYSNADLGSCWSSSRGIEGKGSRKSSSAPAHPATPTNKTHRAKTLLRQLGMSPKKDGRSGRSEESAAASALAAFTACPAYLPFDREVCRSSSSSNTASSASSSSSIISGRSIGPTTPARQRGTTTDTHRTNESITTRPPLSHPPAAAEEEEEAPESWFRPCSESDKRAAKYLINNTAGTSNEALAALVREADARNGRSRGVIVNMLASLRKTALKYRQIAEEDWERAMLEEDEYEVVATTTTATTTTTIHSAMGVRGEKRRKETRERERLLLVLRPDVWARWNRLVVDQDRVRLLPPVNEGLGGMERDSRAWSEEEEEEEEEAAGGGVVRLDLSENWAHDGVEEEVA